MTERDTLLRYILDNPAEDAARLVYADKLQESGKPRDAARAELIRLQLARAGETDGAAIDRSLKREEAILKRWGAKWLPLTSRQCRVPFRANGNKMGGASNDGAALTYHFTRGFISRVEVVTPRTELPPLGCARAAQMFLANNPVEEIRFECRFREPTLTITVCKNGSLALCDGSTLIEPDQWYTNFKATRHGHTQMQIVGPYKTRRELCRYLPAIFADALEDVTFDVPAIPF